MAEDFIVLLHITRATKMQPAKSFQFTGTVHAIVFYPHLDAYILMSRGGSRAGGGGGVHVTPLLIYKCPFRNLENNVYIMIRLHDSASYYPICLSLDNLKWCRPIWYFNSKKKYRASGTRHWLMSLDNLKWCRPIWYFNSKKKYRASGTRHWFFKYVPLSSFRDPSLFLPWIRPWYPSLEVVSWCRDPQLLVVDN